MTMKVKEVLPMSTLMILAVDESGEKQVFFRSWSVGCLVDARGKMAWFQGNLNGAQYIKLGQEECEARDAQFLPLLEKFAEECGATELGEKV